MLTSNKRHKSLPTQKANVNNTDKPNVSTYIIFTNGAPIYQGWPKN